MLMGIPGCGHLESVALLTEMFFRRLVLCNVKLVNGFLCGRSVACSICTWIMIKFYYHLSWKEPLKTIWSNSPALNRDSSSKIAQSPVQPDLECLQRWDVHHISGLPVPVPQGATEVCFVVIIHLVITPYWIPSAIRMKRHGLVGMAVVMVGLDDRDSLF